MSLETVASINHFVSDASPTLLKITVPLGQCLEFLTMLRKMHLRILDSKTEDLGVDSSEGAEKESNDSEKVVNFVVCKRSHSTSMAIAEKSSKDGMYGCRL